MNPLTITPVTDHATWTTTLRRLPTAHVLQTWEWGAFKQRETGWTPERLAFVDQRGVARAAASILTRRAGPLRVMYIPKGPALDYTDPECVSAVLAPLEDLARQRRAVWLKIDPDVIAGTGVPDDDERPAQDDPTGMRVLDLLRARGWRFSASQVQFRHTITLDLTQDEDALLARMSQGTRRKVRLGPKKGVTARVATTDADFQTLYNLYRITGERQGFLIRPPDYYREAWARFIEAGLAVAFLAEWDGRPLAGLVLFHFGPKAWYFYGMSSNVERERMPTYLLQWEAMRWAKAHGYPTYDFWGAPDSFTEDDPMWGVYRFKEGFGGTVVRHIGAWDYVSNPALYWAYERLMPRVLGAMRRLARR
ncbi:MAG TPA: peptidoglycan bridge formation glycyltransferase FemA/FemB family protein [Aggregatilineaceae bacterium]|nr:peptidoglycan bridge formation glycyltransferase FemA/FemB family protein [Aggregatilineaceae bacterium]